MEEERHYLFDKLSRLTLIYDVCDMYVKCGVLNLIINIKQCKDKS